MAEIFISYCHEDSDFAEVVRGRVKDAGFTTWMDFEGLGAGVDWRKEIDDAISDSLALIVILTPSSVASKYVAYEWAFALGAGVRVIPIRLQPAELHPRLAALQYLDFTDKATRPWPKLREELEAASKTLRKTAVHVPHTAPAIVKEAVAALDSPSQNEMERAVKRLAEMNLPEAKEALITALNHPLPEVRIEVARKVAEQGDARALPALTEAVRRYNWSLETHVSAEMGSAAIPALLDNLKDENSSVRYGSIRALENVGDPAVVPHLIKLLEDPALWIRGAAVDALKKFATPEALQALEESIPSWARILETEDDDRIAREALKQIATEKAWITLLLSDKAHELERAEALKRLLVLGTPEALAASEKAVQFWTERDLQKGSWWVRANLEEIGTEKALELISKYHPPGPSDHQKNQNGGRKKPKSQRNDNRKLRKQIRTTRKQSTKHHEGI